VLIGELKGGMKLLIKLMVVAGLVVLIATAVVKMQYPATISSQESSSGVVASTIPSEGAAIKEAPESAGIAGELAAVPAIPPFAINPPPSFWREVTSVDAKFAPVLSLKLEQHRLITFEREALIDIKEQDKVELYIPHVKKRHEVWIERVARLKSGNLSITGAVDGQSDFPFVLTLGEDSVYAVFGTEDGVYNVRGNETHAWMIPTAELKKRRDFKEPDFRTPNSRAPNVQTPDDLNKSNG
jgi:hypothetical protein